MTESLLEKHLHRKYFEFEKEPLIQDYKKGQLVQVREEAKLPNDIRGCEGRVGVFLRELSRDKIARYVVYAQGIGIRKFACFELRPLNDKN